MKVFSRLRGYLPYLAFAALVMTVAACTGQTTQYPNSTFEPKSDLGRSIDDLWDILLLLGTIVFILTELALLFVVWKYRNNKEAVHNHGNTKLEILWTLIPAFILVFIAVPTVRTIFITQAKAPADALKIDVIGHQWWWEFKYPEYGVSTANELYLPVGRTVSFALTTKDVLHSFWIPQLGAKRDLISNQTNYVWLTPDTSIAPSVWNGFCTEFCGASHSLMRFRVFTVTPAQFASWIAGQRAPGAFNVGVTPAATPAVAATLAQVPPENSNPQNEPRAPSAIDPYIPAEGSRANVAGSATPPGAGEMAAGYFFPRESMPQYAIPGTPLPRNLDFPANLTGDPARGQRVYSSTCIGCHTVRGNPFSIGTIGPDLTHVASRHTIAGGVYPNTTEYMARWIKNAPAMKPGSIMPTFGKGLRDPVRKMIAPVGLDDQQIADIVAYLQQLR